MLAEREQLEKLRQQYELASKGVKEDMRRVKEEWEKRLHEEQLECQRQILELQAKHGIHIGNLQLEYQSLMDQKLDMLQREQLQETERLKREC